MALANACSPLGHIASDACARVSDSKRSTVSATGRRLRSRCRPRKQLEAVNHGRMLFARFIGEALPGTQASEVMAKAQDLFVAHGQQRTAQHGVHAELVVGPFDGFQGRAQRHHLFAIVERATAHQNVGYSARFQRLHVRASGVAVVGLEALEEQANVARFDRHERAFVHHAPTAVFEQPLHEADRQPAGTSSTAPPWSACTKCRRARARAARSRWVAEPVRGDVRRARRIRLGCRRPTRSWTARTRRSPRPESPAPSESWCVRCKSSAPCAKSSALIRS